jgi:hypothetical protein
MSNEIQLDGEQQQNILDAWNGRPDNPPSLMTLTKIAFPDAESADGRSKEGRAVKAFLASRELRARGSHQYKAKGFLELTEAQEEYITNNASLLKPLELTKNIFDDDKLTTLSQEFRTVTEFLKTADVKVYSEPARDYSVEQYKPPKTYYSALIVINKYIHIKIDKDKATHQQRKEIDSLIGYMNTYRFNHQINTYQSNQDRELFESSFVRYTNDKADLTQEEVDQYIVMCTEVVISSTIQETIQMLQIQIDHDVTNGNRVPMTLVDASNTARTEYNQCVGRQQKLLNDLKVKRSDRLSKQIKQNASILNLVQMWKEEESRKMLLEMAEARKKVIKKEINKLITIDDVKARILGITEEEILNG